MHLLELLGLLPFIPSILHISPWYGNQEKNIVSILTEFLESHEMRSDEISVLCATNHEVETFMREEMNSRGLPAQYLEPILHLSASLIELGLHDCTLAEKKQAALYNWYMIYIDDQASRDITAYIAFQERFLRHLPQLDPVLDAMAEVLHAMFDYYPVFFANTIINASLDFIAGTCVESDVERLQLSSASARFPWFLRHSTGDAVAYALILFPNSRKVDYAACFQSLADMDFWICGANDLLSYYKESVAGETINYISNRANVEGKPPLKVAADLGQELLQSRKNIIEILEKNAGEKAVKVWQSWEHGYLTWHLLQKSRYKLRDLGI